MTHALRKVGLRVLDHCNLLFELGLQEALDALTFVLRRDHIFVAFLDFFVLHLKHLFHGLLLHLCSLFHLLCLTTDGVKLRVHDCCVAVELAEDLLLEVARAGSLRGFEVVLELIVLCFERDKLKTHVTKLVLDIQRSFVVVFEHVGIHLAHANFKLIPVHFLAGNFLEF